MSRDWRFESHINKTLLLIVLIGFFVLSSSFAVINDETRFQIELRIQHEFSRVLTINQYSDATPIEELQDGSKSVSVSPLNATDSFEVCNIDYSSNVYGRNLIYLKAFPLCRLDNQGIATNESVGYTLDFVYEEEGWNYTLDVSSSSSIDMTIPITVPFVFKNGVIETLSATIGVRGSIPRYEDMSAGTYRATVQIGLEAL